MKYAKRRGMEGERECEEEDIWFVCLDTFWSFAYTGLEKEMEKQKFMKMFIPEIAERNWDKRLFMR